MTIDLERELFAIANGSKPKFQARPIAEGITAEFPSARGGETLYVYANDRWTPNGVRFYRQEIQRRLGDRWKLTHSNEVVAFIEHSAPELWEQPPVDRIAVANGILNVSTGELAPHDPAFRTPVQLPVVFDPAAECPEFERFLNDTLDPELHPVIYEVFGYCLTPNNSLQRAFMLLGPGGTGKSTALDVLIALLGEDNVSSLPLHRFEDRFGPADLYGKLANVFGDLEAHYLKGSSTFKAITGGDQITAERKYGDPFSWRPYCRLLFSANEPPPTSDNSDAYFRRWEIIPFERRLAPEEMDRGLKDRLTAPGELSGILNRGLEVLPDLLARGTFTSTTRGAQAREAFKTDTDSVAGFAGDRLTVDPEGRTPTARVFPAYRDWCEAAGRRPLGKQRFNRRLTELFPAIYEGKIGGVRHWQGVTLESGFDQ